MNYRTSTACYFCFIWFFTRNYPNQQLLRCIIYSFGLFCISFFSDSSCLPHITHDLCPVLTTLEYTYFCSWCPDTDFQNPSFSLLFMPFKNFVKIWVALLPWCSPTLCLFSLFEPFLSHFLTLGSAGRCCAEMPLLKL